MNFSDYISAGVTTYGDWGRVVRKVTRLELDHGTVKIEEIDPGTVLRNVITKW